MERIYFLLPGPQEAQGLVRYLRKQGLGDDQLHVTARIHAGVDDLPPASVVDQNDMLPAMRRGVLIGGGMGLLAGLVVAIVSDVNWLLSIGIVAAIAGLGFGVGGFASALVGAGMERKPVAEAEDALRKGAVLVMVDTPDEDAPALERRVLERFPDARIQAEDELDPDFRG